MNLIGTDFLKVLEKRGEEKGNGRPTEMDKNIP